MSEGNGEIWGQLHALVAQFGPATVSEGIGVEEEYLFAMMSGQALMDREVQERLGLLVQSLGDAVDWSAGNLGALVSAVSPVVLEAGGAKPESPVGEGEDLEVAPGVTLNPVAGAVAEYAAIAAANPVAVPLGQTLSEARLRQMENLWGARDMAVMTQFSVGIDEREALFAMGLVNQIELALIMMFGQSVPDRTRRWDELRTQKEIYIRLVRRNRIERELKRERSGLRGIMNTVRGRRPLSPREVYARLTEYVDDMVSIMEIGNPGEDTVRTVRDFMEGGPMAPGGNR